VWLLVWPKFVSVLEPRVNSNARLRISIFLNRYTFVCGTFSADKAQFAWSAETEFRTQKCNTCRYIEIRSPGIRFCTMVQYGFYATRYVTTHGRSEVRSVWSMWKY
jgi:hypothetical protein